MENKTEMNCIFTSSSGLKIRQAQLSDIERMLEIYETARATMRRNGNDKQWTNGFPPESLLRSDISVGISFVLYDDCGVHGVFALIKGNDPTYAVIEDGFWPDKSPYATIHRIASDGTVHGIVMCAVEYALKENSVLRIDTHELNAQMRHTVERLGFKRCGIIHIADGSPRIAYQLNRI